MQNLAKICAVVAICLGATDGVGAKDSPQPRNLRPRRPVSAAAVSVPQTPLYFGMVGGVGPKRLRAELTARVLANCPFRLMASFQGLEGKAGQQVVISPEQMKMTINGREVSRATQHLRVATGGATLPSGVEVPIVIEMAVKGAQFYPAGRYGGNLTILVMPGS